MTKRERKEGRERGKGEEESELSRNMRRERKIEKGKRKKL